MILCPEVTNHVAIHFDLWPVCPDKSFVSVSMFSQVVCQSDDMFPGILLLFGLLQFIGTFKTHPINITAGEHDARYFRVWRWTCELLSSCWTPVTEGLLWLGEEKYEKEEVEEEEEENEEKEEKRI